MPNGLFLNDSFFQEKVARTDNQSIQSQLISAKFLSQTNQLPEIEEGDVGSIF